MKLLVGKLSSLPILIPLRIFFSNKHFFFNSIVKLLLRVRIVYTIIFVGHTIRAEDGHSNSWNCETNFQKRAFKSYYCRFAQGPTDQKIPFSIPGMGIFSSRQLSSGMCGLCVSILYSFFYSLLSSADTRTLG